MVVGVDVAWDQEQPARIFVKVHELPYPVGRDASGAIGGAYGVEATPTTFFIDRQGKLVDRVEGEQNAAELSQRIETALKSK